MFHRITFASLRDHAPGGVILIAATALLLAAMLAAPRSLLEQQTNEAICAQGDSAAVEGLKQMLGRTDRSSTMTTIRVLATVATARRYCTRGETARAAELYAQAQQAIERSGFRLVAQTRRADGRSEPSDR